MHSSFRGKKIIENPILNKGTAFTQEERENLGLLGLLPTKEETLDEQMDRGYEIFKRKKEPLERYCYLRSIQDENETLFYALVERYADEMIPIIYTPVVGDACLNFHRIYQKPRGLYISYPNRDRIDELLANINMDEVRVVVASDGERILGLGDLGASGMGIPIGKISLYTSCGGLNPAYGLPVLLDSGTDNEKLLNDPFYLGWRHPRVRGGEYDEFLEKFVTSLQKKYPKVLLQWEDFSKDQAHMLLGRYRDTICSFNDDIQGTAAVTLAGLMAAVRTKKSFMKDQRVVILGAGGAGIGIAHEIVMEMVKEGLSKEEAFSRVFLLSSQGLLTEDRADPKVFQKPYLKPLSMTKDWKVVDPKRITLKEVVFHVRPTILLGVSTTFGAFSEEIVREMAKHEKRPIIFPLSNPFSHCEATPEDLISWTEGRALVATGTKYPDVNFQGKTYRFGQCNNYYIFPAIGLAVVSSKAVRVSDGMLVAAANALSEMAPALKEPNGSLFPDPREIRDVAKKIAFQVAIQAQKEGLAEKTSDESLMQAIEENFWHPCYRPYT